jgi:hypothetical protein
MRLGSKASFPLQPYPVAYRRIFFSSTLVVRKQRNTLRFGTIFMVEKKNWLKNRIFLFLVLKLLIIAMIKLLDADWSRGVQLFH